MGDDSRSSHLEEGLKRQAVLLGFELVGIAPPQPADGFDKLQDWLSQGYAGDMDYMHRHGEARRHPGSILPGVRSVVMVALNYNPRPDACAKQSSGKIARYARGDDYHEVLRAKLKSLLHWVQNEVPGCSG